MMSNPEPAEASLPIWVHLEDLRVFLLRSFAVIGLAAFLTFMFAEALIGVLQMPVFVQHSPAQVKRLEMERVYNSSDYPLAYSVDQNDYLIPANSYIDIQRERPQNNLTLLSPIEGMLASVKVALWVGLGVTSPVWGFFLLQFIYPGLKPKEVKVVVPFMLFSLLFIIAGLLFAYFFTIPLANQYLFNFNSKLGINSWSLLQYLDYTLLLLIANAIGFELCAILLFAVYLGRIPPETLTSKRRHVIVGAFVIAALLTPPDVLTQFLMAVPMLIIYEIAILLAKVRRRITSQ